MLASPIVFQEATQYESKLRLALSGPPGSGKTHTALAIAAAMSDRKPLVIDTEHGSSAKERRYFTFDMYPLAKFDPSSYVEVLHAAQDSGNYDVVVLDSISHEWSGKGGVLQIKDDMTGNSFTNWGKVTPMHDSFVEAILASSCHIIVTVRERVKHEIVDGQVKKLGLDSVQRGGWDYEYDLVFRMNSKVLTVDKSRCEELPEGHVIVKPDGQEVAATLKSWLSGAPPPPPTPLQFTQRGMETLARRRGVTPQEIKADCLDALGLPTETIISELDDQQVESVREWTETALFAQTRG